MGKYDTGAVGKRKKARPIDAPDYQYEHGIPGIQMALGYKMEMRAVFWVI